MYVYIYTYIHICIYIEVDCSRHIDLLDIHFNKAMALEEAQTGQLGRHGRWGRRIDAPALTANIFVAASNISNINKKTDSKCH